MKQNNSKQDMGKTVEKPDLPQCLLLASSDIESYNLSLNNFKKVLRKT